MGLAYSFAKIQIHMQKNDNLKKKCLEISFFTTNQQASGKKTNYAENYLKTGRENKKNPPCERILEKFT
jgi:hypothetical protein